VRLGQLRHLALHQQQLFLLREVLLEALVVRLALVLVGLVVLDQMDKQIYRDKLAVIGVDLIQRQPAQVQALEVVV
jgi:hypothetical protein